jgi:hypothetical protein
MEKENETVRRSGKTQAQGGSPGMMVVFTSLGFYWEPFKI